MMIRVAMAQQDFTVGDIAGNVRKIKQSMTRANSEGAQVLVVPELAITGYPPEDLLLKQSFLEANEAAMQEVAEATGELLVVVGFVDRGREDLFNAAALCHRGSVLDVYRKHLLPNYGVFDENRYFEAGRGHVLLETEHAVIGVCVCEDIWSERGPAVSQGDAGAQVVLNINASPFHKGKMREREALLCDRARRANASIVYVNSVGGQDELVFDGGSLVVDAKGLLLRRFPQFREHFEVVDVPLGEVHGAESSSVRRIKISLRTSEPGPDQPEPVAALEGPGEIYSALCLGLSDYVTKNGFTRVVIGLSGGIDSALTASIAADALGPSNVLCVAMPSEFSSSHSISDAKQLAQNLGVEMIEIPIAPTYRAYLETLTETFGKSDMGLAEENLQARIRGNLLMAISNRYGHLVLATGNKSEMACGYATLYGDMAGGFALLKDLFKTEVYELCDYRNELSAAIPEHIIHKPPSAELRPDQKDSDSLPAYDKLDPILEAYIEHDAGIADMVAAGHERRVVEMVVALVDRAEYKRRQAPPGPKVTTKAFGRDRRLPITNRWKEGPSQDLPERSTGPHPSK